jgi:hypothetical protein
MASPANMIVCFVALAAFHSVLALDDRLCPALVSARVLAGCVCEY